MWNRISTVNINNGIIFPSLNPAKKINSISDHHCQHIVNIRNACLFSAPEPKRALLWSCVVRRPSVVNFSHFRRLLWNRWTEFIENWQEVRSQRPLPSLCFSGRSEKQDGRPGLWLSEAFSTSPLKPLNGIQWNLTGSKISTSSTKFVFFGLIGKTRWPPWPLICREIFFSPLKPQNGIQRNLTGIKISTSSTKLVGFFLPVGKTRWPPWSLIDGDIFDFSSETTELNSTKLDRKQDLNILYQVCVFRAVRKNKMVVLSDLSIKVEDWTQVHDMWPFEPLVSGFLRNESENKQFARKLLRGRRCGIPI